MERHRLDRTVLTTLDAQYLDDQPPQPQRRRVARFDRAAAAGRSDRHRLEEAAATRERHVALRVPTEPHHRPAREARGVRVGDLRAVLRCEKRRPVLGTGSLEHDRGLDAPASENMLLRTIERDGQVGEEQGGDDVAPPDSSRELIHPPLQALQKCLALIAPPGQVSGVSSGPKWASVKPGDNSLPLGPRMPSARRSHSGHACSRVSGPPPQNRHRRGSRSFAPCADGAAFDREVIAWPCWPSARRCETAALLVLTLWASGTGRCVSASIRRPCKGPLKEPGVERAQERELSIAVTPRHLGEKL